MILETLRRIICHPIIVTQAPRVKSVGKERFSRTEYWHRRKDRRGQDKGEIKGVTEPWLDKEGEMTRKTGRDDQTERSDRQRKQRKQESIMKQVEWV